ncbi:helix-turn-helix domain-containing protein [Bacteroidota bacterium]
MIQELEIQKQFFEEVRKKLSPSLSLADVVSDELNISADSAYRRIRGESGLSLDEAKKLCLKFDISLDSLVGKTSDFVVFDYRAIALESFGFDQHISSILDNLRLLKQFDEKKVIYSALDLPFFYYYIYPNLAAFKHFFWMRNLLNYSGFQEKCFDPKIVPQEILDRGKNIWEGYLTIPSIEIWSDETINTTLRQINFYHESGMFKDPAQTQAVLEDVRMVISHLQKQADCGCKFLPGKEPSGDSENFKLYYNEVILSDNTIFLKMGDLNTVHVVHNVLNILTTSDPVFCKDTMFIIERLLKNSTMISVSSEKERNRFFNILFNKIDVLEQKIL